MIFRAIPNWKLSKDLKDLNKTYQEAVPFKNLILDHFFSDAFLNECLDFFPQPFETNWWTYKNPLENKMAKDDLSDIHYIFQQFVNELMENRFVHFLEAVTGMKGLIVDPSLNGGGLHQIAQGGKLDIHADYNYHPVTRLDRRLNVLIYLNRNWKKEWKGELEFWDAKMQACQKSIEPCFNRMVIFETNDTSFHGHPDPLECPKHVTRKSIALYYYTNGRPEQERSLPHSTLYQKRPQDKEDPEIEELRKKRSIRRL